MAHQEGIQEIRVVLVYIFISLFFHVNGSVNCLQARIPGQQMLAAMLCLFNKTNKQNVLGSKL